MAGHERVLGVLASLACLRCKLSLTNHFFQQPSMRTLWPSPQLQASTSRLPYWTRQFISWRISTRLCWDQWASWQRCRRVVSIAYTWTGLSPKFWMRPCALSRTTKWTMGISFQSLAPVQRRLPVNKSFDLELVWICVYLIQTGIAGIRIFNEQPYQLSRLNVTSILVFDWSVYMITLNYKKFLKLKAVA